MSRARLRPAAVVLAGLALTGSVGLLVAGQPRLSIAAAAVAALLVGLVALGRRADRPPAGNGGIVRYAVPGDDFTARLRSVSALDRTRDRTHDRDRLGDRVGDVAAELGIDDDSIDRFRRAGPFPDRGVLDRLREFLRGTTRFERLTRRAIDASYRHVYAPVLDRSGSVRRSSPAAEGTGATPEPSDADLPEAGDYRTGRWRPLAAVALGAGGLGAATGTRPPLLVAGVCAAFLGYGRLGSRTPPSLTVERRLSSTAPAPGETVTVSLRVRNDSGRTLPSVRVRDPVPPGLTLADGTAELATALRAGATIRLRYEFVAARGEHEFTAPVVTVSDLPGSQVWIRRPPASGTVTCVPVLDEPVATGLPDHGTLLPGSARTDAAGAGLDLHSVREYRPGDPFSRIDWAGLARSGELRTVEFHRERTLSTVLILDARRAAYCAPEPSGPPAVERSATAARRLADAWLAAGHRVGVAALSPHDCWLPPAAGAGHRAALRRCLALHPAFSWRPPAEEGCRPIRDRLLGVDLAVVLSPLVDDRPASFARRLAALEPTVRVVSPNPTDAGTPGRRFARLAREARQRRLRRAGLDVIDWPRGERLDTTLARSVPGDDA